MQLVRYNPFRTLEEMEQDFNKMWENSWSLLPGMSNATPMDMYEEDGKLVTELTLPGFKKDDIRLDTDEGVLEIYATHHDEDWGDKKHYYFRESTSQYFRRIALPEGADANKANASFEDNVLRITMPFSAPKKAKQIELK